MTTYHIKPAEMGATQKLLKPHDVVHVWGGVTKPVVLTKQDVSWIGHKAVIDGSTSPALHGILVMADGVSVKGFEVRNVHGSGVAAAKGTDFFSLSYSYIHNNEGHGVSLIGGTGYVVDHNEIAYNYGLKANKLTHATSGISLFHPRPLEDYDRAYGAKITNNDIHHNGNEGRTDAYGVIEDKADRNTPTPYDTPILIKGNTIHENGGGGMYFYKSDNAVVKGNRLWHNGQDPNKGEVTEIGLNEARNVKFQNNIAEAMDDHFVFQSKGAGINNATFKGEVYSTEDVAPWSNQRHPLPDAQFNHLGVDPHEMFPWWPCPDDHLWDH